MQQHWSESLKNAVSVVVKSNIVLISQKQLVISKQ